MRYQPKQVIGGQSAGPRLMTKALRGIDVAPGGFLHAAGDQDVKILDRKGALKRRFGTEKPGFCVTVATDGLVHVGESGQVETFDATGRRVSVLRDGDRLGRITAVGFSGKDVLLGDATHRCIRRYSAGGQFLNDIGKDNRTRGFMIPNGHVDFAVDRDGIIHATNPGKHRVERYTAEGKLIGRFGRFGGTTYPEGFTGCCNPTNVALAGKDRVVVTTKAPPQVKVYDASGALLVIFGTAVFEATSRNMDVAVDERGWVYVADTARLRICAFAPVEAPDPVPEAQPAGGTERDE